MLMGVDGHWDEDVMGNIGTSSASKIHKSTSSRPIRMTKMKSICTETIAEVGNGQEEEGGMVGAWWLSEIRRPVVRRWPW